MDRGNSQHELNSFGNIVEGEDLGPVSLS